MAELLTPENLVALLTLTSLEIVLGIDNIVFISILVGRLPETLRPFAMRTGLALAMLMRLLLLFCVTWLMTLTEPLFDLFGHGFSGKDLILLGGGLFLMGKATHEIHHRIEVPDPHDRGAVAARGTLTSILIQIVLLDIVFSIDSVITAVGMAEHLAVMAVAVIVAVGVMMFAATAVSGFVDRHPTIKMLCLAFLLLIGLMLTAEGFGQHIERGYIYFAMGFSLTVELLNLRVRAKSRRKAGAATA